MKKLIFEDRNIIYIKFGYIYVNLKSNLYYVYTFLIKIILLDISIL